MEWVVSGVWVKEGFYFLGKGGDVFGVFVEKGYGSGLKGFVYGFVFNET